MFRPSASCLKPDFGLRVSMKLRVMLRVPESPNTRGMSSEYVSYTRPFSLDAWLKVDTVPVSLKMAGPAMTEVIKHTKLPVG